MVIKIWFYVLAIMGVLFLTYSCKNEDDGNITNPIARTIGERYGGGTIFYIDNSGQHGLIAASKDQSENIQWFNGSYAVTGATATAVGAGQLNTTIIINIEKAGSYAASICDQLVLDGYSDRFLPSKDELNLLYLQKEIVGGFTNNFYWSSTEYGDGCAWEQNFINGTQYYANKNFPISVRAIRAF